MALYCSQNVSVQIFFYFSLGEDVYASIDSWTSAAEIASILIQKRWRKCKYIYTLAGYCVNVFNLLIYRGLTVGVDGWSLTLEDGSQRLDLMGYGYLLDAVSYLEVPYYFPATGPSPHLPSWVGGIKKISSAPSVRWASTCDVKTVNLDWCSHHSCMQLLCTVSWQPLPTSHE